MANHHITPIKGNLIEVANGYLQEHDLIIASNRGPMTIQKEVDDSFTFQKGSGGLVTALMGLAKNLNASWIASAMSADEREWKRGAMPIDNNDKELWIELLDIHPDIYHGYYNVISNPLLWFLQHSMWDFIRSPSITKEIWDAWYNGYVEVNRLFAHAIESRIMNSRNKCLVMLQDYHLYLTPYFLRQYTGTRRKYTILHFIHIPWPGAEDWGILPPVMRQRILEGLCNTDILGFQTRQDSLNFIRTCESHLPGARVNFRTGRVSWSNHVTHVRDFPISIDVQSLKQQAKSEEVANHYQRLKNVVRDRKMIVRVDRTEPSKNIVRGFHAFGEMFAQYPEHLEKVVFVAIIVPSRLKVLEYQEYLDEIMAAAGRVNAAYGTSEWEPIRVLVGEDYDRAIAAMQLYDVLLVNAIADGMNLVAKEGPIVNEKNGVLVLSERVGAHQQLGEGSLIVSPCDIYTTAQVLHQALTMNPDTKQLWNQSLIDTIEHEDINYWFCSQVQAAMSLRL